jgi:uncharacterized protein (TIGR02001 family)
LEIIKMMKKTLLAGALLAGSTAAMAEISANVSLATDYVFRGVSQTDENPAIQGGFDWGHGSGLYLGAWASNVQFNENVLVTPEDSVDEASIEIDYYGGFANSFSSGLGYDVGAIYYSYPGASGSLNYDFYEFYGGLDWAINETWSINGKASYSPEFFGKTGSAWYFDGGVDVSLPSDWGLFARAGYQTIKDADPDNYVDWSVGVTKGIWGVDLGLTAYGTNGNGKDFAGDLADTRGVLSISKSL